MKKTFPFLVSSLFLLLACSEQKSVSTLPELPPMPEIPQPLPKGSVPLGSSADFPEVQLDIPIMPGPFQPSWESIEANHPGTPQWLRDAKVGFWVHFGPQSAGESGDWYARRLYVETDGEAYPNHLRRFGHPSEVGYKDVLRTWNPDKLDPARLTKLYKKAGARFLMIMGVHHDNFDLWDSHYQPWNAKNIGPKRDLLGEWSKACHKAGMRFGVTFHHEYTWWWWQTAFWSDSQGPKAGVPYDGHLTLEDGKGKWWEGYDPRRLYGIDLSEYETVGIPQHHQPANGIFGRHLDYARWYATQWALRMMDVTRHYDPDFIYTDGTGQGPFSGFDTGTGYKCNAMPIVMADFYNRQLKQRGRVEAFSVVKFRRPTNGTVNTAEFDFPDNIDTTQTWIRETPVGDWYYRPGFVYDAGSMERFIIESVCRDGCVALNIPLRPDGSLEAACEEMLGEVGKWMEVNGQGIYGSRAWQIPAEGIPDESGRPRKFPAGALGQMQKDFPFTPQDIRFTQGRDGKLYAFCMKSPEPGQTVSIRSLGRNEGRMGEIRRVKMLGAKGKLKWQQTDEALEIACPEKIPFQTAVAFQIE